MKNLGKYFNSNLFMLTKRFFFCVSLFAFATASCYAQSKKELKEKAKTEAKAEKMLTEQAAKMEAEGWKVMKGSATLLEVLKEKRAKEQAKMETANGEIDQRYLVNEAEDSGVALDKALKACQTKARKELLSQVKSTVESETLIKTKSKTESDGTVTEKTTTSNFVSDHVSVLTNKVQELARLFCKTEDGYKVKVVMFVDLKE